MREEYKLQLKQLKERMEKAEAFATRCPIFAEKILEKIITGEEPWITFADHYKSVQTYSGVHRGYYNSDKERSISNWKGNYNVYLWSIYINTLCEYDSSKDYGLDEIHTKTPVFFYDDINSTFYCTDEQIGDLLDALDKWKIEAIAQLEIDNRGNAIKEVEKQLKEINDRLSRLKNEI